MFHCLFYSGVQRDPWVSSGHKKYSSDYSRVWGTNNMKNSNTLSRPDGNHSRVLNQFKDEIGELLVDLCNLSFNTFWVLRIGGKYIRCGGPSGDKETSD